MAHGWKAIEWEFPKMGDPQVTGFNTKIVIHDDWMIWGYHHFRNPHMFNGKYQETVENHHGKLQENMENTSCLLGEYGDTLGKQKRRN